MNKALREKDEALEREAQLFVRLLDSEWQHRVSSIALRTMKDDKRNKPDLIPLTSDLMKMKNYLQESIQQSFEKLNAVPNKANYMNLVDVALSRIILFNKRRGGEAARMLVSSYHQTGHVHKKSGLDDIHETLTKTEQQLCSRMRLVEIAEKQNRTVSVLLTQDVVKAVEYILSNRDKVRIDAGNEFVFACSSGLNSIDACGCLRRVAESAGVQHKTAKVRCYSFSAT